MPQVIEEVTSIFDEIETFLVQVSDYCLKFKFKFI